ncbi:uncharacterized protein JCM6883_006513 [Sporobolomyces salmoneus]|uniref:uncharacterized protein n=1 Tax=Sporobolomyces salmoneus TaxID=183962 RepID=UPI00317FAC77
MSQILLHQCFCMSRKSGTDGSTELVAVVPCGHVLHKSCLKEWWTNKQGKERCPSCSTSIKVSTRNPGFVSLFGLNPYTDGKGGSDVVPSSDGMTQDTQQMIETIQRRRAKGKGRMVVHDDEEEEETDSQAVAKRNKELLEALKEVEDYKKHSLELEAELKTAEDEIDSLRIENEGLNEELSNLNADILEDAQDLNARLEEDVKKLTVKVDSLKGKLRSAREKLDDADRRAQENKERIRDLEEKVANEGDEGSKRIVELEGKIDDLERQLMHAKGQTDKLELEREQAQAQARTRMEKIEEEARRRVQQARKHEEEARNDLLKERDVTAKARLGNKSWESRYSKLQKKYKELQRKKGKPILDSDSDNDLEINDQDRRRHESPARKPRSRSDSGRQPLATTSSHNYLASPSPPPPAFKVKNHSSLVSPVKNYRAVSMQPQVEEEEEDDIYAPVPPEPDTEDDEDSEIEIMEPTPLAAITSRSSKSNQLDFTTSHAESTRPSGPSTIASKYFSSSSSSSASLNRNPLPSLSNTSTSTASGSGMLGKRPFERSKSDKYLPDFGREGVVVQTGPKNKIRRLV